MPVDQLKLCKKCLLEKPTSEFPLIKIRSHGRYVPSSPCKKCSVLQQNAWIKNNPVNRKNSTLKYYENNKEKCQLANEKWTSAHPWAKSYIYANSRCNKKKASGYKYYGGKGIKMLMSVDDFKTLWFRDKAYLMRQPSIDRLDSNKNYELSNCRYIETLENRINGILSRFNK